MIEIEARKEAASRTARLDAVFAALADPTRRAIIERLSRSEARVTEVAEPFDMSLNAVSKHIRVLEASGVVERHRKGRDHILSINTSSLDEVDGWIERTRGYWEQRLDAMEHLLRELNKERKLGPKDRELKDRKPKDRKPEDRKPEDRKPEDRKPEDRKPKDRKPKDRKPKDRKHASR